MADPPNHAGESRSAFGQPRDPASDRQLAKDMAAVKRAERGESRPTMGFVRGYFAGWSDAKAGREYGGTRPSGWDVYDPATEEHPICGLIAPNQGPNGEPLACAWPNDHLPTPHSWAWVPTVEQAGSYARRSE